MKLEIKTIKSFGTSLLKSKRHRKSQKDTKQLKKDRKQTEKDTKQHKKDTKHELKLKRLRLSGLFDIISLCFSVFPVLLMTPVFIKGNLSDCGANFSEPYR